MNSFYMTSDLNKNDIRTPLSTQKERNTTAEKYIGIMEKKIESNYDEQLKQNIKKLFSKNMEENKMMKSKGFGGVGEMRNLRF